MIALRHVGGEEGRKPEYQKYMLRMGGTNVWGVLQLGKTVTYRIVQVSNHFI